MKKIDLRQIGSSPTTHHEQSLLDKESLINKEVKPDKLNTDKTGLELAGLKPCTFGEFNPNFDKHSIR